MRARDAEISFRTVVRGAISKATPRNSSTTRKMQMTMTLIVCNGLLAARSRITCVDSSCRGRGPAEALCRTYAVVPTSCPARSPSALTSIRCGRSDSGLGMRSLSTPSEIDASIASGLRPGGTRKLRWNLPNPRSTRRAGPARVVASRPRGERASFAVWLGRGGVRSRRQGGLATPGGYVWMTVPPRNDQHRDRRPVKDLVADAAQHHRAQLATPP